MRRGETNPKIGDKRVQTTIVYTRLDATPSTLPHTGGPKGWPGYAVAYPKPALFYPNDFFNLDLIKFKL